MYVLEAASTPSKAGGVGEDVCYVREEDGTVIFGAVIDGVTDKSGVLYDGKTGGRIAAEVVAQVVSQLDPEVTASDAVAQITTRLRRVQGELGISLNTLTPPSASVLILSGTRREVWRVGDSHIGLITNGIHSSYPGDKAIDVATSMARSAFTACLLALGDDPRILGETDPGRDFILPLLQMQNALANSNEVSPFTYGVLNGTKVPERHIEVLALPRKGCEVILASDGYLHAAPSLREAEKDLQSSLRKDPLRIGEARGTKALKPGANSFDDRTYLRVHVDAVEEAENASVTSGIKRRLF